VLTARFKSRASSKRRCRPFFTMTPEPRRASTRAVYPQSRDSRYHRKGLNRARPYHVLMPQDLDVDAMLNRFRERARAVRQRGVPPLEGPERKRFVDQARTDYMDYAMIGDAAATLEGGILTLTIDLRPAPAQEQEQPPS
jgi:hypothetical protein